MSLTPKQCYEVLDLHYRQCLEEETARLRAEMEFHLRHTKGVFAICQEITCALPPEQRKELDQDLLSAAAILHDVAKFDGAGEHNRAARRVIADHLDLLGWDDSQEYLPALADIIAAHRGEEFEPKQDWVREAAVLRLADKLDMRRRGLDKKEQFKESRKLIRNYFQRFPEESREARFLSALLETVKALPTS